MLRRQQGVPTSNAPQPASTTADVFRVIWDTLVSVLGATACATLVRRAARHAVAERPELAALGLLDVTREGMQYRYVLPPSWHKEHAVHMDELRYFFRRALCPLLQELTGPVVIGLLERQPELRRRGFVHNEEEMS
jgi:hypothetical protein